MLTPISNLGGECIDYATGMPARAAQKGCERQRGRSYLWLLNAKGFVAEEAVRGEVLAE
jgi:hypothetical protein